MKSLTLYGEFVLNKHGLCLINCCSLARSKKYISINIFLKINFFMAVYSKKKKIILLKIKTIADILYTNYLISI